MKSESFFLEMNCQQCREECEKLLDESLPVEQRSEIEANISAHIDTCPECAGEFALVQNLRLTLPQMQTALVEPPTFLRANIRAALVEEAQAKSQKKFAFALPLWTRSMWAGGLVLAFGFVVMSQQLIPFSEPPVINDTKLADRGENSDQTSAPSAALPSAGLQSKKPAPQKPQLSKNKATNANADVLPERIPAPRQRVFSAPAPSVDRPQPLVLPEVKPESEKPRSVERPKAVAPSKPSAKNAPVTSNPPAPVRKQSPDPRPIKDPIKPAPQPVPDAIKPAVPGELFMARSNNNNHTAEKSAGGGADAMASATTMDVATPDWRNGKITLAVVPPPTRATFSAKSTTNAVNAAPELAAPQSPITNGAVTNSVDGATNRSNEARPEDENNADFNRNRLPKVARGGGEYRMPPRPIAPSYATPRMVTPSTQGAEPTAVIPRKLTLQSEFAVTNARLLQNGTTIWQGDLPAKKPITIEWMTPLNPDEKISFVLEQFGANGESNRKSLNLGD